MAAKVRRTTVIRADSSYSWEKGKAVRDVVAALQVELETEGLSPSRLTAETKPGRYTGSIRVEARLTMESR